jgi:phosphoribosyl-ATP pyrophosphohydrolase
MSEVLDQLWRTVASRKAQPITGSYTARLLEEGVPRIARKVGEEGVETAVAALSETDERVLAEMADLFYHCFVLLAAKDLTLPQLEAELESRFKP